MAVNSSKLEDLTRKDSYRPEIDGLRAIAVAIIILFHAGFELLPGGYLGVDIFFVISGYLITLHIIRDLENGQFSIAQFYEKRARRILPALFLVVGISSVLSLFLLLPPEQKVFFRSVAAVATFSSNFLFWSESGYFDIAGHFKPLLHTWSLSLEEQFYILYPLFLLAIWRKGQLWTVATIVCLTAASLAFAHWGATHKPGAAFYLLPWRGWELLLGGGVAFFDKKRHLIPFSVASVLSGFGIVLIISAVLLFSSATPHPSIYTLAPVAGTALILVFTNPRQSLGALLASRPLRGLGLVSYSAYLWHQPVFAYARIHYQESLSWPVAAVLCATVLMLSFLSWRFIEQPFRNQSLVSKRLILNGGVSLSLLFILVGVSGYLTNGYESLYLQTLSSRQTLVWKSSQDYPIDRDCQFSTQEPNGNIEVRFKRCVSLYGKAKVVVGDSHGIDVYQAIATNSSSKFIFGLVQGGCRPGATERDCRLDEFLDFITRYKNQIELIIYNQAGRPMLSRDITSADASYKTNVHSVDVAYSFVQKIAASAPTIWLGPIIEPEHDVKSVRKLAMSCQFQDVATDKDLERGLMKLDRDIESLVGSNIANLKYISLIDILSSNWLVDIYDCDAIYWLNGDHWSSAGEKRFGTRIVSALKLIK